ncbi:MAG: FUSC family protein [Peptostreptococcaceae bacterium]
MKKSHKQIISTIVSKTLIFVFVVLIIGGFKSIFGEVNSLVGVTSVVLMLSLLQRDLTRNPIKNLVKLAIFNVTLGLGAYLVTQNIWIGLVVNFSVMCFIGYVFSYELRNSLNMLFGLHYILMLTSPISSEQLPMRLAGLVFGACMIMAAQLLANKNKLIKSSDKILANIEEHILVKVELLKNGKDTEEVSTIIENEISKLKMMIYDSGKIEFNMTEYSKNRINILSCLEKINILLESINKDEIHKEFLYDIYEQLINVKDGLVDIYTLEELVNKYEGTSIDTNVVHEFIFAIENLIIQKEEIQKITKETNRIKENTNKIPEEFKSINTHKRELNIKSNRVAYGIRLGLLVAMTSFVTNFFNLEFGNWMVYTVFALTQPYSEYSIVKSKKRVIGTIAGAIVVFILFNLVKDPSARSIILMATGYLMSYVSDYKHVVIFVTISSICSAGINIPDANLIIINRLVFVGIGVVISLLANKFILERKYKDEEIKLNNMQKQISNRIIEEVLFTEDINGCSVENLFLIPSFIENKLEKLESNLEKEAIHNHRKLVNHIHQIYLIGSRNHGEMICNIKDIIIKSSNMETAKVNIKEYINTVENSREKALLKMIMKTIKEKPYTNSNAKKLELEVAL